MKVTLGELAGIVRARPKHLVLTNLAALYADFSRIFLGGKYQREHVFVTLSGHTVHAFDHNFFHLVKLKHSERGTKFRMELELKVGTYIVNSRVPL